MIWYLRLLGSYCSYHILHICIPVIFLATVEVLLCPLMSTTVTVTLTVIFLELLSGHLNEIVVLLVLPDILYIGISLEQIFTS